MGGFAQAGQERNTLAQDIHRTRLVPLAVNLADIFLLFDYSFCKNSYDFRPGCGCHDAVNEVRLTIEACVFCSGWGLEEVSPLI